MATAWTKGRGPSTVAMRPLETIISGSRVPRLSRVVDSPHPANAYDRPKAPADLKKSLRVRFLRIEISLLEVVAGDHAPLLFLHGHFLRSLITLDKRRIVRRHHG